MTAVDPTDTALLDGRPVPPSRFVVGERDFLLDGDPFRVLSGALHYFRVHPDLWADRIRKARMLGLNTIETYVPWNLHEPRPGEWHADAELDLGRFLDTVHREGMRAIVRPGPYICAEFDNGGLPAWLFEDPSIGVRSSEPGFLRAVRRFLAAVHEIVVPRQVDRDGPVILVQVENEYGAYGDDAAYLDALVDMVREDGVTVPLTTVDQPQPAMLVNGSRPGLLRTASFGSDSPTRLAVLREHQPSGPLMCSEYWNGWFDSWGTHHHTSPSGPSAADLDALLSTGASVNLYMFHGGTNFGMTSGANDKGAYRPIATSYDYDAPLDEAGNPTDKYWAFREVIARHAPVPDEAPAASPPAPTGDVPLRVLGGLVDAVDDAVRPVDSESVPTFGALGLDRGFVLHTAHLASSMSTVLDVGEPRDRVHVFVDGVSVGVISREDHDTSIGLPPIRSELRLLVENQGRVNYGTRIGEDKGIVDGVRIDGVPVTGWRSRPFGPDDLPRIADGLTPVEHMAHGLVGPALAAGTFTAASTADRFLDMTGFGRGLVWVNGFCLGRYWSRGPQRTLYVPGPLLRAGRNEVLVLELRSAPQARIRFAAVPELGQLED